MTQYVVDLMQAQRHAGDDVAMLWPGRMPVFGTSPRIVRQPEVLGVESFELIRPLPVPLREGIADPVRFRAPVADYVEFIRFLTELKPDVLHVHTLMGLHREFLEVARSLDVKVVYTSHDYFGICPHVNMFHRGRVCPGVASGACGDCCSGALSMLSIRFLQSRPYRVMKDSRPLRAARAAYRSTGQAKVPRLSRQRPPSDAGDNRLYLDLLGYHKSMFELIDLYHFNSTVARDVFLNNVFVADYAVLGITHAGLCHDPMVRACTDGVVDIAYLGPFEEYKGFFRLIETLDALSLAGLGNFRLHVFGASAMRRPYMVVRNRFRPEDRGAELRRMNLLVVPSLCNETFGFTVLEAMSEGLPVIATESTGASDLISSDYGMVVSLDPWGMYDSLAAVLERPGLLRVFSENLCRSFRPESVSDHASILRQFYGGVSG